MRDNGERAIAEMRAGELVMTAGPQFIELETTSRCNLDCLQCPREPGPQGVDVPAWVVEALAPVWLSLQNLSLHGLGEPLMARRTDDIVRGLSPATHVWFSSNLQILTDRHIELLRDRLGAVSCSLDAATPETYALVRGGDLARSLTNIRRLRAETRLKVFINMTVMKMNFREVGRFVELGRELGVDKLVLLRLNEGEGYGLVRDRGPFHFVYDQQHLSAEDAADVARQIAEHPVPFPVEDNVNLRVVAAEAGAAGAAAVAPADAAVAVLNPHADVLCHMPWTNLHVRIDGSVRVCCHHEPLANLADRGVEEIWNGPELRAMRGAIASRGLHTLCHRDNCPVYRDWQVRHPPATSFLARAQRATARAWGPIRAGFGRSPVGPR